MISALCIVNGIQLIAMVIVLMVHERRNHPKFIGAIVTVASGVAATAAQNHLLSLGFMIIEIGYQLYFCRQIDFDVDEDEDVDLDLE